MAIRIRTNLFDCVIASGWDGGSCGSGVVGRAVSFMPIDKCLPSLWICKYLPGCIAERRSVGSPLHDGGGRRSCLQGGNGVLDLTLTNLILFCRSWHRFVACWSFRSLLSRLSLAFVWACYGRRETSSFDYVKCHLPTSRQAVWSQPVFLRLRPWRALLFFFTLNGQVWCVERIAFLSWIDVVGVILGGWIPVDENIDYYVESCICWRGWRVKYFLTEVCIHGNNGRIL